MIKYFVNIEKFLVYTRNIRGKLVKAIIMARIHKGVESRSCEEKTIYSGVIYFGICIFDMFL